MTALDLIKAALRVVGVTSQGNPLSSEDAQNGLEALQIMLRRMSAAGIAIPHFTTATATLVPENGEYSIGAGGDINTTRPTQIRSIFIRDSSGNDNPVTEISSTEYQNLSDKDSPGRPYVYWYNPTSPMGRITLWPVPKIAETLSTTMLSPLTSPTDLTDNILFPPEYDALIKWTLAVELFPEYGLPVNPDVAALASATARPIIANNAAAQITPIIDLGLPISVSSYNITTDQ